MLTPNQVARIDGRLRQLCNCKKPFGGKNIILVGDFFQFPPVAQGNSLLKTLYGGLVRQATSRKMTNKMTIQGISLFANFIKYELDENNRSGKCEKHNSMLNQIRNPHALRPFTDEIISQFEELTKEDIDNDNSWRFAPIAVTSNIVRHHINKTQVIQYGQYYNEPILRWNTPMAVDTVGNRVIYQNWKNMTRPLLEQYPMFEQFFVRGAPCTITENICTKLGLANGSIGKMVALVWSPTDPKPHNLNAYTKGEITTVTQPKYILVEIQKGDEKFVYPIEYKRQEEEIRGSKSKITYRGHPVELTFAITYHKLQSRTCDKLIMILNKQNSNRLKSLSFQSLYVGISRVRNAKDLKIFSLTKTDIENLKNITMDPLLKIWYKNYSCECGKLDCICGKMWNKGGLQMYELSRKQEILKSLEKVEFIGNLNVKQLKYYLKELDICTSKELKVLKAQLIKKLEDTHKNIATELEKIDQEKVRAHRLLILKEIQNYSTKDFRKLKIDVVRAYALQLGIQHAERKPLEALIKLLQGSLRNEFGWYIDMDHKKEKP